MRPDPQAGDPDLPAAARVYSALCDGADHYPADRELAAKLTGICPELPRMAADNRAWQAIEVLYAVAYLGIRQFLDLGSGFPGPGSVAAVAAEADARCVTAAVDWDPLIDSGGVILADIGEPGGVLEAAGGVLDLSRPVLVVAGAVLHYWPVDEARALLGSYTSRLAPGSAALVTTAAYRDQRVYEALRDAWIEGTGTSLFRYDDASLGEVMGGLEVLPPGPGPVSSRPLRAVGECQARAWAIGALGVKR